MKMASLDTIMALVFGLLSSITGIFSALIAYFTLRAMRVENTGEQPRVLENGLLLRHEHTYRVLRDEFPRRGSTKSRRGVRIGE